MRFPHFQQNGISDCSITCLKMISAYYGRIISNEHIRQNCHVSKQGASFASIQNAGEALGFRTKAVYVSWKAFCTNILFPCIIHWNHNHFVVVYKVKKRFGKTQIYVADPAAPGMLKYQEKEFLTYWLNGYDENNGAPKGPVMMFEPSPYFYEDNSKYSKSVNTDYIVNYIAPYWKNLLQLLLAIIIASVINLMLPYITQSIVDKGINNSNIPFIRIILLAQVVLTFGQTMIGLVQSWLMLHMTTRISISIVSDFLAKLMRLPIAFFDSTRFGEIIQRIEDTNRIRIFLTESLLNIILAFITVVIYGCIIGCYNGYILNIFFIGSALYIIWIILFLRMRRKLDYKHFQQASANQSSVIQLIGGMQDIKLNNCERQKRWGWERIQVQLFKLSIKTLQIQQAQSIGGFFINQTKNIMISYFAAKSVIEGQMTLGMMISMQYIIGQLNAPIEKMISFFEETQDAKISINRIGEINNLPDEESGKEEFCENIPENSSIEFKNVSFQYDGNNSNMVLKDISFMIPHKKITAIVGPSGSGKTTILKLILGFYKPTKGELMLGNKKIEQYSPRAWRSVCGMVYQDGYIFNDTILGNIVLSEEKLNKKKLHEACRIANITEYIESLPQGYNTVIGTEGQGLSSGQKQRILIARAAYKNSKYLLLDEATNSLDANNEKKILEQQHILFKDKTVIIVAHRLSTIKDADKIVVVNNGEIVEQGQHEELLKARGFYYELIKNQLD